MLLVGRSGVLGGNCPISFEALLDLHLIILGQGVNTWAVMDDPSLLTCLEKSVQFQMNAIAAIAGALLLGVSRIVGTEFLAIEQRKVGNLVAWPIIKKT